MEKSTYSLHFTCATLAPLMTTLAPLMIWQKTLRYWPHERCTPSHIVIKNARPSHITIKNAFSHAQVVYNYFTKEKQKGSKSKLIDSI